MTKQAGQKKEENKVETNGWRDEDQAVDKKYSGKKKTKERVMRTNHTDVSKARLYLRDAAIEIQKLHSKIIGTMMTTMMMMIINEGSAFFSLHIFSHKKGSSPVIFGASSSQDLPL